MVLVNVLPELPIFHFSGIHTHTHNTHTRAPTHTGTGRGRGRERERQRQRVRERAGESRGEKPQAEHKCGPTWPPSRSSPPSTPSTGWRAPTSALNGAPLPHTHAHTCARAHTQGARARDCLLPLSETCATLPNAPYLRAPQIAAAREPCRSPVTATRRAAGRAAFVPAPPLRLLRAGSLRIAARVELAENGAIEERRTLVRPDRILLGPRATGKLTEFAAAQSTRPDPDRILQSTHASIRAARRCVLHNPRSPTVACETNLVYSKTRWLAL